MTDESKTRPRAITALSVFFLVGAVLSFTSSVSLILPGSFLEPIWRLNPRAHDSLIRIGPWAVVLLFAVSVSCAAAAIGLWYGSRWGHRLAVSLIGINLVGDIINALLGTERRAIVGVPVAAAILACLMSTRVRRVSNNQMLSSVGGLSMPKFLLRSRGPRRTGSTSRLPVKEAYYLLYE